MATLQLMRWLAPLYGRRATGRLGHAIGGRRLFLWLALIPVLLGAAALVLVAVIVDPYDVRPWGLTPRIADHRYPDVEWALMSKVVARQDHRLVLFGASTFMPVSRAQLEEAFGNESRPVNLAYPFAAPADTREALQIITPMPSLKRLIFVMDHSQMMDMRVAMLPARLRSSVFASNWAHAGDFKWDTIRASWRRLTAGRYDLPEWETLDQPQFMADALPLTAQPKALQRMQSAIERHSQDVLGTGIADDCSTYPFIDQVLTPALRDLRQRGVDVDLVFPPYLNVMYYDWIERRTSNDPFAPGSILPQMTGFKRCVLLAARPFGSQVRVHTVDADLTITGDLANYKDSVHMLPPAAYRRVLQHVANGDSVLTLENFPAYRRMLETNILAVRQTPPAPLKPVAVTKPVG